MPSPLQPILLACCLGALAAADPSAHDPQYGEKGLWPEDVQKTAYAKETWPQAPLYVWATVVTGKDKGGAQTDPKDPASWTVDGKPATTPPDRDSDIIFPSGSVIRLKEETSLTVRHVTVGKGVRVVKPCGLRPLGNVWIKEGGTVENMGSFTGPKNVFLRNDKKDWRNGAGIANKIVFNKPIGSSIEILGAVLAWDEMGFFCGTVIVGPDAHLVPGNRSSQPVYPDAQLVLMSGANFHKRGNQPYETDLIVSGEFHAGTAERPLTRDCTLGLSFKAKGEKGLVNNGNAGSAKDHGLVVNPKGKFAVHSVDPAKARLVITWNGLNSNQHQGAGEAETKQLYVDLVLQGQVDLAGVLFDCVRTGGIHLANQAIREQGKLAFGAKNQGKPDELFTVLEKPFEAKLVFSSASVPKPASQGGGVTDNPKENK